jgi:hypothetical protein
MSVNNQIPMSPLPSLTQRYLAYYTPLIQEFVREVESLPHPDMAGMPEPFFPLFGKRYEQSALRLVIIGQDTRGWWDLRNFLAKEKASPGSRLQDCLAEFQDLKDGKHSFTDWGHNRNQFWGFAMMMLAALHGQEQWGMMKQGKMNEVLDSFAWGNCNAVELYKGSFSKRGITFDDWNAVRKAGARFDRFKHIAETLKPHAAIVLWRGMNPATYFEGYRFEVVSREGRLIHYRLPEIGVDVFHAPHPQSMGRIERADHFCSKLKELFFKGNQTKPFPKFLYGQADAEEVLQYLQHHAPPRSPVFDKYAFVAWVAEELRKRDTFMSVPTLIELVNTHGDKTNYGTEYIAGRGSYKLVSGTYHRMKALGSPDGDTKAHNVAVAFRKPNFEYAYSTD